MTFVAPWSDANDTTQLADRFAGTTCPPAMSATYREEHRQHKESAWAPPAGMPRRERCVLRALTQTAGVFLER